MPHILRSLPLWVYMILPISGLAALIALLPALFLRRWHAALFLFLAVACAAGGLLLALFLGYVGIAAADQAVYCSTNLPCDTSAETTLGVMGLGYLGLGLVSVGLLIWGLGTLIIHIPDAPLHDNFVDDPQDDGFQNE